MPTTIKLGETPDLQVFFHRGNSPYLLVTWSEMEMKADGVRFWGDRLAEQGGINTIGIMATRPHWFPGDAVAAVMPLIQPYLDEFAERVVYGHSMGGYAALKYGRLLGARTAIAFCPQLSIDPEDVGEFDDRYIGHFEPARHRGMAVGAADAASKVFLFYDPWFKADRAQIERIEAVLPKVRHVRMPMSGHETIWLFAGTVRGGAMIEACRRDDVAAVRAIGFPQRRSFNSRPYFCALALAERGRTRWAKAVYDAGCREIPDKRKLIFLQALTVHGKDGLTAQALADALAVAPDQARLMEWAARLLAERGRWEEADSWAARALEIIPSSPDLLDLHGAVLMELGRLGEAERALRAAVRAAPGSARFTRRLAHIHARKGDLDTALDWAERAVEIDSRDHRSLELRRSLIERLMKPAFS